MADKLTITTFDGHSINDGTTYEADFLRFSGATATFEDVPVAAEVSGDFEDYARGQPQGRIYPLRIRVLASTLANVRTLKGWMTPFGGEVYLKAVDEAAVTWRLKVKCVQLVNWEGTDDVFVARLWAARPIWEADSESSDTQAAKSSSPIEFDLTNAGCTRTPPTFKITPTASKNHDNGYKRRCQVIVANKVPRALHDTLGLGYPLDIVNGTLDIAAEVAASRLQADYDDLRVYVDGKGIASHVGVDRWLSAAQDSPTNSPTAAVGTNWTLPNNVFTSDNQRTTYNTTTQDLLKITDFDHAIPTDAMILGITVYVEGVSSGGNEQARKIDVGMTKDGAALAGDYKQQVLPTVEDVFTLGGAADLWGTTWTPAQLNATNFGVLIRDNDASAAPLLIDHVQVRITYQVPQVWINVYFRPGQSATLDGALAADRSGTDFPVDNAGGTAGWPESGFAVVNDECFYYGSKLPKSLEDCVWGVRNTTKAAHADEDTVYWVEHEITIEYDYTAVANPPAPTDTKPVIDLASTNAQWKYPGPFVVPDTLRTGQWRPYYTAENDLSPYISLYDTATALRMLDAAAVEGKPQYNNIELYLPCLVQDAANALTHDIVVSGAEHLLARLYGSDESGFEALLASYYALDAAAAIQVTPTDELVRLRWNVAHCAIVGQVTANANQTLGINTAEWGPGFTLDATCMIVGWVVRMKESSGGTRDTSVMIREISDPSDVPNFISSTQIDDAEQTEAYQNIVKLICDEVWGFDQVQFPAGTYVLVAWRDNVNAGEVYWASIGERLYPRSGTWSEGSPWTEDESHAAWFLILGDGSYVQEDSVYDTDDYMEFDDIRIALETPPYVNVRPSEETYSFHATVENTTTGQSMEIYFLSALNKTLTINCETGEVTSDEDALDRPVPWAVVWEDEVERLHLDPGVNSMAYTEASIGTLGIVTTWRGRWS